jgi:hypothetical protein
MFAAQSANIAISEQKESRKSSKVSISEYILTDQRVKLIDIFYHVVRCGFQGNIALNSHIKRVDVRNTRIRICSLPVRSSPAFFICQLFIY